MSRFKLFRKKITGIRDRVKERFKKRYFETNPFFMNGYFRLLIMQKHFDIVNGLFRLFSKTSVSLTECLPALVIHPSANDSTANDIWT